MAFRALTYSGLDVSAFAASTLQFLKSRQAANGSWDDDIYVTARVLEALAAEKPNLIVRAADIILTPATTSDGSTVTARITVRNIGAAASPGALVSLFLSDAKGRKLAEVGTFSIASGASQEPQTSFVASGMSGPQTITVVIDSNETIGETNENDNVASVALNVVPRADLRIFPSDIAIIPAVPAPGGSLISHGH